MNTDKPDIHVYGQYYTRLRSLVTECLKQDILLSYQQYKQWGLEKKKWNPKFQIL